MLVLAVDAAKTGWIAVALGDGKDPSAHHLPTIDALQPLATDADAIAIDIPIGIFTGGAREADVLARAFVGARRNSVFLTPCERPSRPRHTRWPHERHSPAQGPASASRPTPSARRSSRWSDGCPRRRVRCMRCTPRCRSRSCSGRQRGPRRRLGPEWSGVGVASKQLDAVGVEGTGAYGAGLARHLRSEHVIVVEVPRPERRLRRSHGKSDPVDAEAAARAVLAGTATIVPKRADGPVEAVRALRVARLGAIKAKTAATNTLRSMIISAPEPLRTRLPCLGLPNKVMDACARLRPDGDRLDDPMQATKAALRSIAHRAQALRSEIRQLDLQIRELLAATAPATLGIFAMGPDTTAALLVAIGDNPDRLRSEAAFARLAVSLPFPPPRARPCATACTGAETDQRIGRCTSPSSFACATALEPRPT